MKLIVWNSQGDRSDTLWDAYIKPLIRNNPNEDIIALALEAGWAPWIAGGQVTNDKVYWLDSSHPLYDQQTAQKSWYCTGVQQVNGSALWIPWVNDVNGIVTNARCSLSAAFFLRNYKFIGAWSRQFDYHKRPAVCITLGNSRGDTTLSIVCMHLISGFPRIAAQQLESLVKSSTKLFPAKTPAIFVGDMNADPDTHPITLPKPAWYLKSGESTQQSGKELDYGVLWNPNDDFETATVEIVETYKSGRNYSDHAVMLYTLR